MQADMSLEESGTVFEAAKNRGDYDQWVVRTQQGVKHQHYDSRIQGHGQERVEDIQSCKMSGWLTTKLFRSKKLWVLACSTDCTRHRKKMDSEVITPRARH